jgi:hypothetical protein
MASVTSAQTLNYFDNLYCRWAHQIKANYHGNLTDRESYKVKMDQPKRRIAQQARHNHLRFAYGAASARLRPAS